MRIAITGASGFVGQQVVPHLLDRGIELVLIGRNQERFGSHIPDNCEFADYSDLASALKSADAVLHLAVVNSDAELSLEEFRKVNVELLKTIVLAMRESAVRHLIYPATIHSMEGRTSNYAISKIEAENYLADEVADLEVTLLNLPAVYGDNCYAGNLSILFRVPPQLRPFAFDLIASLRPTVHSGLVAKTIAATVNSGVSDEIFVSDRQMKNRTYCAGSRLMDLLFCVTVLGLFWWLLILIWIAVKLTSPGPALFIQERIGKCGHPFFCYKFRTMHAGTPTAGTHEISAARVTKIGQVLRKLKLDELPQIWNILLNQMSLVGPRPCLPIQKDLINERNSLNVLDAKCGITGLAQINGNDMSEPRRLARLDAKYLALRTLPLDIKILLRTFLGAGLTDRVK